jgi:hypothetical protein
MLAFPQSGRGRLSPVVAFFGLIAAVLSPYAIIARRMARKHWAKIRERGSFDEFYASYTTYWKIHNRYQPGASFLHRLTGKADRSIPERDAMTRDEARIIKACQDDLGDLQGILHALAITGWFAVLLLDLASR